MSYWCKRHPDYEAKTEPPAACTRCAKLFFYKNPERKHDWKRILEDDVEVLHGSTH